MPKRLKFELSEFRTPFRSNFGIVWISEVWISDIHCKMIFEFLTTEIETTPNSALLSVRNLDTEVAWAAFKIPTGPKSQSKCTKLDHLIYKETRPVWTGFKIAVRPKLLTHYYKVRCLYKIIICNKNYDWDKKMCITMYQINKPKMFRFLKFKYLIMIRLNFNGDQFYNKILNFDYFKKL